MKLIMMLPLVSAFRVSPAAYLAAKVAASRTLDDRMARVLASNAAMTQVVVDTASIWTRNGLKDAMAYREKEGLRAKELRNAVAEADQSQLVIIPAGLDTIAHDPKIAMGRTVFEIDHPKILSLKEKILYDHGGYNIPQVAESIHYILEDPNRYDAWSNALLSSSYNRAVPTTWMVPDLGLEKLNRMSVLPLLRSPLAYSPQGSTLIFRVRSPTDDRFGMKIPSAWMTAIGYKRVEVVPVADDEWQVLCVS